MKHSWLCSVLLISLLISLMFTVLLNSPPAHAMSQIRETVIVEEWGKIFEVTVLDFVRGVQANKEIREANIFNPEPKEGFEYLMVKVKLTYISGKETAYVSEFSFKAYVEKVGYSPAWVILPKDKPEFPGVDLLPGGEIEGWIAYEIPQNKEVLIAYEYGFEPLCFISIREPTTPPSKVKIEKLPSTISISVSPKEVKIGETVKVTGKIEPVRANVIVKLKYVVNGEIKAIRTTTTLLDGSFTDVFTPKAGGLWNVKASWSGSHDYEGSVSKGVTFTVRKLPSTIMIATETEEVEVGKELKIMGKLEPPLENAIITLTYTKAGKVKIIRAVQTGTNGTFMDTVIPDAGGIWKVKASWEGNEKYEASKSQELTFEAIEKRCIIATATYGSELAPQVQYLRGFREAIVYKTYAGNQFMKLFNTWYYAWSPHVASLIWTYPILKPVMQVILYPLLGILHIATLTYTVFSFNSEIGIIIAGLIAGILIGLIYFTPPTMLIMLVLRKFYNNLQPKQSRLKPLLLVWLISIALLAIGEIFSPIILTIASGIFIVLTIILTASTITIKILNNRQSKFSKLN